MAIWTKIEMPALFGREAPLIGEMGLENLKLGFEELKEKISKDERKPSSAVVVVGHENG